LIFLLAAIILQKLSCHSCQQLKDSRLGTTSRLQSCRFCSALMRTGSVALKIHNGCAEESQEIEHQQRHCFTITSLFPV
jgi:hypothetical protein